MDPNGSEREGGSRLVAAEKEGFCEGSSSRWLPRGLAFGKYGKVKCSSSDGGESCSGRSGGFKDRVGNKFIVKLTKNIVDTFQTCNPNFKHSEALNPKRYLTSPNVGVSNDGYDNENSDLILSFNFVLFNRGSHQRYIVKEMLGQGTFGQVARCWVPESSVHVAIKVIKNQPAYYNQAILEVNILGMLNNKFDRDNKNHIVRMLEFFVYRSHLCISFEILGPNLYDLIKSNNFKGLHLSSIQTFSKQILKALLVMKDASIIHCDLKPENILLWTGIKPPGVKVIDFGSACKEGHTVYSYIQSRYYRSPEVLLGYPYTTAIDMWSLGCIAMELFLGLPLFAGNSEYDLLKRMINVIGAQPPDFILHDAKRTANFFKHVGRAHQLDESTQGKNWTYCLLTEEEFEAREGRKPIIGKWYFNHVKLADIVVGYPYRRNLSKEEKSEERLARLSLIDFVRGLLEFDPKKRWTPLQASGHPFVTGEPFTQPYCPPVTYNNTPVILKSRVDHAPDRGHWLVSGLSPQVSHMSRSIRQNNPHIQMMPFYHAGGYGSWGSYSSYSEKPCLVGSYGDNNNVHDYYPAAGSSGPSIPIHIGGSSLGASPDARGAPHYSYSTGIGMSPTGSFRPISLGTSPSQFTPPSSQIQVSNVSPGNYGPTSPAKGSSHGSQLGKSALISQYNKRSWGNSGPLPLHYQQGASPHTFGHHFSGRYSEKSSQGSIGSPRSAQATQSSRRKERSTHELPSGVPLPSHQFIPAHMGNVNDTLHYPGASSSQPECSSKVLDPSDWDPYYSDDLLLQEDGTDTNSIVSGISSIHLDPKIDQIILDAGSSRHKPANFQTHPTSNSNSLNTRIERQGPAYSHAISSQSVNDVHSGYNRPVYLPQQMIPYPQNSPSRFSQQPAHNFHQVFTRPTYISLDPQVPIDNSFHSSRPWGQQTGNPIAATLPTYSSINGCGKIS